MKKYAVIAAGGLGTRMASLTPKQFLTLQGKPLLWYTLRAFLDAFDDLQFILVLPQAHLETGTKIIEMAGAAGRAVMVAGGETRYHSVQNGLKQVQEPSIVFVHDAVRCLLTPNLIHRCYQEALEFGSAIPVVQSKDSVRIVLENGSGSQALPRTRVKLVQTPQTFKSEIILPAFRAAYHDAFTDEASVVEASGNHIHLVEGEENNIKITTPLDLELAAKLIRETP